MIIERPTVSVLDKVTVKENTAVRLPCNVTGSPEPEIRWMRMKDGVYLPEHSVRSDGVLEIEKASRSWTGNYACEAHNRAGKRRKETKLDVLCKKLLLLPSVFAWC